jgi:hypothetical protein
MLTLSMKSNFLIAGLFAFSLVLAAENRLFASSESVDLKGPIPTQGTVQLRAKQTDANGIGGMSAPGADAIMTPDMLLVTPTKQAEKTATPLKDLTGTALKLQIERSDIVFDKLRGVMITVSNETNRPLVIDGDQGTATIGNQSYTCVPVSTIQQAIIPPHKGRKELEEIFTNAIPAAATVGVVPTVRDILQSRKPILQRYGRDELRRKIEYSRFGRRILWTNQKGEGVLYFKTESELKGAKISIPVTTLFDTKDTSILSSAP